MNKLQTVELVEIDWGEDKELCYQVDIVVLVKNKLMFHDGHGSELHLDCVTTDVSFNPMTLELYYDFKSGSPELIEANKKFQIGKFFRVKGDADSCFDLEYDSLRLYEPDCKQIRFTLLPQKFIKLLVSYLGKDDLCYDYMGADHMQVQYKKSELFPWLNQEREK